MIHARRLVFITILLLVGHLPTQAQDAATAGWPVVQRCVSKPTLPPDDWRWQGQIYVRGIEGIRVLDADYATPYFVLFDSPFIYGAALSPDGKWFAVPFGYQGYETMIDNSYVIRGIEVVSTDTERKSYFIPWQYYGRGSSAIYAVPHILWQDAEHFLYVKGYSGFSEDIFEVNPFNGVETLIEDELNPAVAYFSPDGQKALRYQPSYDTNNSNTHWDLYVLPEQKPTISFAYAQDFLDHPLWLPDSSGFVAGYRHASKLEGNPPSGLSLFTDKAEFVDVIFVGGERKILENTVFSSDSRYLSFTDEDSYLYLADMSEKQVIDTCLRMDGVNLFDLVAWMPGAHQLAFTSNKMVLVYDVDAGTAYPIAEKLGQVVAWGMRE